MSLITCPDCQREISDVAPACPGCGRPMVTTASIPPCRLCQTALVEVQQCPKCKSIRPADSGVDPRKPCRKCGEYLMWILQCPKDQAVRHPPEFIARETALAGSKAAKGGMGAMTILKLAFGALILGTCISSIIKSADGPGPAPPRTKSEADNAQTEGGLACRDAIKRALKAPSTADFPWSLGKVASLGGGRYRIDSHVDAQNGFGAMLRQTYQCVVRGAGNAWAVESACLDGKCW